MKLQGLWVPKEGDNADYEPEEGAGYVKVKITKIDATDDNNVVFTVTGEDQVAIDNVKQK